MANIPYINKSEARIRCSKEDTFAIHDFLFRSPPHTELVAFVGSKIGDTVFFEQFVIILLCQLHLPRIGLIHIFVPQKSMIFPDHVQVRLISRTTTIPQHTQYDSCHASNHKMYHWGLIKFRNSPKFPSIGKLGEQKVTASRCVRILKSILRLLYYRPCMYCPSIPPY